VISSPLINTEYILDSGIFDDPMLILNAIENSNKMVNKAITKKL